jgi:hypothetical protein
MLAQERNAKSQVKNLPNINAIPLHQKIVVASKHQPAESKVSNYDVLM